MPNWVFGNLKIKGPEQDLKELKAFVTSKGDVWYDPANFMHTCAAEPTVFSFTSIVPPPPAAIKDFQNAGYKWCCNNWGTKWDASRVELVEETSKKLTYAFDTAWSPATPVIVALSKKFPKLSFIYYVEEDVGSFKGSQHIKNGRLKDYVKE